MKWYYKFIFPFLKTHYHRFYNNGRIEVIYYKKYKNKIYYTDHDTISF